MAINASWVASAASASLPVMRRAERVDAVVVEAQELLEGRPVAVPGRRHQGLRRVAHVTAISEICSCQGRWHGGTLSPREVMNSST